MADHQEPEAGAGEVESEPHAEDLLAPPTVAYVEVQRPWWFWALVIVGVLLVVYGIGNAINSAYLYRSNTDKDAQIERQQEQIDALSAVNACRSQIAADDAVAQGNKAITSQRVIEVAAASAFARDPSLTPEERVLWAEAASKFREVFLDDLAASRVRYDMALRRSNANELCKDGDVPEAQVQPLPVEPIVNLPEIAPSSNPSTPGGGGAVTPGGTTTAPPPGRNATGGDDVETAAPVVTPPPRAATTTVAPSAPTTTRAPSTPTTTVPSAPTTTTRPGVATAVVQGVTDLIRGLF